MGFPATVVVGLVAGWIASPVTKARTGLLTNLILGVIGGFVEGWLRSLLLGENLMSGINMTSIAVAPQVRWWSSSSIVSFSDGGSSPAAWAPAIGQAPAVEPKAPA